MPSKCTEHYQLSQWEPEDRVLRTDFNEDNAKIDAALKGLDKSITSLNSSISTINTNLGTKASTTSLNSAVNRIATLESGKVDKTAHTADVSALRGENCWVKLGEKYTTADGQTAKVVIPNISAYRELEIVFWGNSVSTSSGSLFLACNDVQMTAAYSSENSFNNKMNMMYLAELTNDQGGGTAHLFPLWPSGQVALYSTYVSNSKSKTSGGGWSGGHYQGVFEDFTWDSIKSLTLFVYTSNNGLTAGSGMAIYGLKK